MNPNMTDLKKMEKMAELDSKKLTLIIGSIIKKYDNFKSDIRNISNYPTIVKLYKFQFEYFVTLKNIDYKLKNKLNLRLLEINAYLYGWESGVNNWLQKKTIIFLYISLALGPLFPLAFDFITANLNLELWIAILIYILFVLLILGTLLLIFICSEDAEFKKIKKNLNLKDLF